MRSLPVLREHAEPVPQWLMDYKPGDPFPREQFFNSRILYYPGSATDGHPIECFGQAHAVHCFVYADYTFPEDEVVNQLRDVSDPDHPVGYKNVDCRHLKEGEVTPQGWIPHLPPPPPGTRFADLRPPGGPFARWAVMERESNRGEEHGPKRWCVLHIGGDGIATFDALFCQRNQRMPFAMMLQDHGYGLNYTVFGGEEGPLWRLVQLTGQPPPQWILAGDNTPVWPGYEPVASMAHPRARVLYRWEGKHMQDATANPSSTVGE